METKQKRSAEKHELVVSIIDEMAGPGHGEAVTAGLKASGVLLYRLVEKDAKPGVTVDASVIAVGVAQSEPRAEPQTAAEPERFRNLSLPQVNTRIEALKAAIGE